MIDVLIQSKISSIGEGFNVRRALPTLQRRMVGPFIFFDHMGPVDFEIGNGMDVRPHPHIGLSTLTYLFEGEAIHRDTLGIEQAIRPGDVNWMTAGSGVAHSERSSAESRSVAQRLHGIQTWLALPKDLEEMKPSFFHHSQDEIPEFSFNGNAVKVIAGSFEGLKSPVCVHSPVTYLDVKLCKGEVFEYSHSEHELAAYCVSGVLDIGGILVAEGALGVFKGADVKVIAKETAHFLLLGGKELPEKRHIWWNFVSSSKERIEQAKTEWKEQAYGNVKGETEWLPLPEK